MTFTTKDEVDSVTATVETENMTAEGGEFLNYKNVRRINHPIYDHTYNGTTPPNGTTYAIRLNGSANERIGLAKSLSVMPGDTLNIEVYAKYYEPPTGGTLKAFATLMASIIAGTPPGGTFIDGTGYSTNSLTTVPGSTLSGKDSETGTPPKAYLNWLVFDRNYNLIMSKSGYKRITTAAKEDTTNIAHERLAPTDAIVIGEAGYAYIYISNENETPVEVYFDDFTVEHVKSPVVQSQDYYPFGLTFGGYQRELSFSNQIKYNGFENEDELGLDVNSSFFRVHDPALGRWWQVDPKPDETMSPYVAMNNNPILYNDLLGDTVRVDGSDKFKQQYQKDRAEIEKSDAGKEAFNKLDEHPNDVNISEATSLWGAIKNMWKEGSGDKDHLLESNTEAKIRKDGTYNANVEYSQVNGVELDDTKSQSHLTLMHEVSHALDVIDGTMKKDNVNSTPGQAREKTEIRAMDRANQVAFELNQPQRTVYGKDSSHPIRVQPITKKEKLRY